MYFWFRVHERYKNCYFETSTYTERNVEVLIVSCTMREAFQNLVGIVLYHTKLLQLYRWICEPLEPSIWIQSCWKIHIRICIHGTTVTCGIKNVVRSSFFLFLIWSYLKYGGIRRETIFTIFMVHCFFNGILGRNMKKKKHASSIFTS